MTSVSETRYSKLVAGFTKLFSTIIHSTVWREEMHVKVVWVTMLAMADRNGRVYSSLPGLADASRVSLDQCLEALQRLAGPDPYSRTKEHEGRRIVEIDGGWELLNYLKYRETRDADERRLQTREAVRRLRLRKAKVSQGKPGKPKKAQAEAEAEAEAEADRTNVRPPVTARPRSDGGPSANPLMVGKRPEWERRWYDAVHAIAKITGEPTDEVAAKGSKYEGMKSLKLNPANMSDDRLMHTVRDLEADLAALKAKRGA